VGSMTARRSGWDRLPLLAGAVGTATGIGYLWLADQQGGGPEAWFSALLVVGVLLAFCGAATTAPSRTAALAVSGSILAVLGLVGIFSVGLPLLVAAGLVLTAGFRSRRRALP
jgi:hypothetical protein